MDLSIIYMDYIGNLCVCGCVYAMLDVYAVWLCVPMSKGDRLSFWPTQKTDKLQYILLEIS